MTALLMFIFLTISYWLKPPAESHPSAGKNISPQERRDGKGTA
jgi:hypothetical protein